MPEITIDDLIIANPPLTQSQVNVFVGWGYDVDETVLFNDAMWMLNNQHKQRKPPPPPLICYDDGSDELKD